MNPNKIPNVVFIGAKETGKTTTIEKLWNKKTLLLMYKKT